MIANSLMSCCRRNRSPRKSQTFRPAHMELIHRKMPNPFMVFKDFAKTWFSGEARLGRARHLRLWRNDPNRLRGTSLANWDQLRCWHTQDIDSIRWIQDPFKIKNLGIFSFGNPMIIPLELWFWSWFPRICQAGTIMEDSASSLAEDTLGLKCQGHHHLDRKIMRM